MTRTKVMEIFKSSKLETASIPEKGITPEIKMLRAQGDAVWVALGTAGQLRIATAGDGDRIHSLRIWIPVVNNSEQENKVIFASLSALFSAIYPDWQQAKDWPQQSAGSSWAATAREMNPKTRRGPTPSQPDDLIPSKRIGKITASTFGVPPDIVVYAVTARDACIPKRAPAGSSLQDDPIQRFVC